MQVEAQTRFWGKEQGPTVFLWESLGEEGREECERVIRPHRDWVVWSRAQPMTGDCTLRGFEHVGKVIFCGKVKRKKKNTRRLRQKTRQRTMLQTTKSMGVDALAGRKGGGSVGL